jgi:hypothetical protein
VSEGFRLGHLELMGGDAHAEETALLFWKAAMICKGWRHPLPSCAGPDAGH